ncbi:unnamed protein product [Cylindrotheca closterium]|uniref:Uncharacterized protein n=1 Tax=Cylindrotheca closterium TaxID=2856 RepID=A0AAD2PUU6_9STRA|nr:unnamed protein product [Cylindrotheca closterium]
MITAELLEALLSPDLLRRSQAEEHFQSLAVLDRVQGLMNQLGHNSPSIQLLAPVLLRRDILKLTDINLVNQLILPLLASFPGRPHVGHCLAEVCATLSIIGTDSAADAALQKVLAFIEPALKQGDLISIRLLADLADRAPMAFARVATPSLSSLISESSATSSDCLLDVWTHVLVNGAIATTIKTSSLSRELPKLDELQVDPASPASQTLSASLTTLLQGYGTMRDEESIKSCMEHLSQATIQCPSLLGGNEVVLNTFLHTCLQFLENSKYSSSVQLSALETLTSFLSVGSVKRNLITRNLADSIAAKTVPVCAQLMANGVNENFDEWASEPATLVEDAIEDEDEAVFAESLFESILQHLGGAALTVALPLVQQLLSSEEWKHARAALAMLECGLVSTPISLVSMLPLMLQAGISLSESVNLRVQWQAIRLLGILGETSDPSTRETHAKAILARLAMAVQSPCNKVSAMASLGIVSFCRGSGEQDDVEDAAKYVHLFLPDLLNALMNGPLSSSSTDTGSITARVRAMGALACLAESVEEKFFPFYRDVMPGLLLTARLPIVELTGAAVEAATIVGRAVGLEVFRDDAKQLLSWILPVLQSRANTHIPLEQLLSACARVASVLGEEFAPFVDVVLPILLEKAKEEDDISITEANESGFGSSNEYQMGNDTNSITVAVPGKGFTKVTINTSKIEEKSQAIRAVYEHAKALGALFGPYVQVSLDTVLPLLNFPYSADVRSTSAQTLAAVFEAACAAGANSGGMHIPQKYLPGVATSIANQIEAEDPNDMESLYALSDSLSEILFVVYQYRNDSVFHREIVGQFSVNHAQALVQRCMQAMVACLARRKRVTSILGGALTSKDEQEEYLRLLKAEEVLLTSLVDSVGYTLKMFRVEFVPIFESLVVPVLGPILSSTNDIRALHSALCLFVDCVEHCGKEAASKQTDRILGAIMGVIGEGDAANRDLLQTSVYGIAQISRYAPGCLTDSHIQMIVHALLALTDCSKEEAGDDIYLVEVAASALASITLFGRHSNLKFVTQDTLVTRFLNHLPIQEDEDEAKICHAGLCHLIESQVIDVSKNAVKICQIAGQVLSAVSDGEEIASPETCENLVSILKVMRSDLPQDMMQQAYSTLHPEAQQAISAAIYSTSSVVTP